MEEKQSLLVKPRVSRCPRLDWSIDKFNLAKISLYLLVQVLIRNLLSIHLEIFFEFFTF
jgi:hypothetical protein